MQKQVYLLIMTVLPILASGMWCQRVHADAIWKRAGARETSCAQRVLIEEEQYHQISYRYLDNGIIQYGACSFNKQKGESVRIDRFSRQERRALIARWKKLGHTIEITDVSDTTFTVFNAGLHFFAPRGVTLLCTFGCPAPSPSIELKRGEAAITVDFSDINTLLIDGNHITLTLVDGSTVGER